MVNFVQMVAVATATSHVRGTVGASPGQFKEVLTSLWQATPDARERWTAAVADIALAYREQVVLDYQCFRSYVGSLFPDLVTENQGG